MVLITAITRNHFLWRGSSAFDLNQTPSLFICMRDGECHETMTSSPSPSPSSCLFTYEWKMGRAQYCYEIMLNVFSYWQRWNLCIKHICKIFILFDLLLKWPNMLENVTTSLIYFIKRYKFEIVPSKVKNNLLKISFDCDWNACDVK